MAKHETAPGKPLDMSEHNHPPAKREITQRTGGSVAGSGTRPNDPKS